MSVGRNTIMLDHINIKQQLERCNPQQNASEGVIGMLHNQTEEDK